MCIKSNTPLPPPHVHQIKHTIPPPHVLQTPTHVLQTPPHVLQTPPHVLQSPPHTPTPCASNPSMHYRAVTVTELDQRYLLIPANVKDAHLVHILSKYQLDNPNSSIIVFVQTCKLVHFLFIMQPSGLRTISTTYE